MKKEDLKLRFIRDLLEKREIYLEGEITDDVAKNLGKAIVWLNAQDNQKEINLYIDSGGGSVLAGLDIYDALRFSKAPITGIVYRKADSMAIVALQACKVRKAMKHSSFSLHNLRLMVNKEWDEFEEKAKEELEQIQKEQEEVLDILAGRARIGTENIKRLCKTKKIISADEALELGLIDEVI